MAMKFQYKLKAFFIQIANKESYVAFVKLNNSDNRSPRQGYLICS